MSGPPKGDLVQDADYLREVKDVWQRSHANSIHRHRGIFDDLRGEPMVAWAGRTPAGSAAVVVHEAYLHPHASLGSDSEGLGTLVGFIGEGPGGQAVLIRDGYPAGPPSHGFLIGSTLVVLDDGHPVGYATRRNYADNGSITRDWTPLQFRDGAATVTLPPGTHLPALRLGYLQRRGHLLVAGQPEPADQSQLLWGDRVGGWSLTPGATRHGDLEQMLSDHLRRADPTLNRGQGALWHAHGQTANGSQVMVTEYGFDDDPPHVFGIVKAPNGKTRIVHGGIATRGATLPVRFRLPDGQGWVTVNFGAKLQHRLADGTWSGEWDDALLVPDEPGPDDVRVTAGGKETVVSLD